LANNPPHQLHKQRRLIRNWCGGKNHGSIKIFGFQKITPFAKKVYKAVLTIPLGEVRSYKWVAQKTGKPNAARAVGQVLKRNPWPLIIPCHRVVCSGGKIGGYSSGTKKKKIILDLEKQISKSMV